MRMKLAFPRNPRGTDSAGDRGGFRTARDPEGDPMRSFEEIQEGSDVPGSCGKKAPEGFTDRLLVPTEAYPPRGPTR